MIVFFLSLSLDVSRLPLLSLLLDINSYIIIHRATRSSYSVKRPVYPALGIFDTQNFWHNLHTLLTACSLILTTTRHQHWGLHKRKHDFDTPLSWGPHSLSSRSRPSRWDQIRRLQSIKHYTCCCPVSILCMIWNYFSTVTSHLHLTFTKH